MASTAKQRGKDNAPTSGKNGVGVGGALAAGAAGGMLADNMTDFEKADRDRHLKNKQAEATMNKYDKKAHEGAALKQDKELDKLRVANGNLDRAKASGVSGRKLKRLEKAQTRRSNKYKESKQYAEDIAKYGKVGAIKRKISRNTAGAKSRLQTLNAKHTPWGKKQATKDAAAAEKRSEMKVATQRLIADDNRKRNAEKKGSIQPQSSSKPNSKSNKGKKNKYNNVSKKKKKNMKKQRRSTGNKKH